jgi:hypothetical protein
VLLRQNEKNGRMSLPHGINIHEFKQLTPTMGTFFVCYLCATYGIAGKNPRFARRQEESSARSSEFVDRLLIGAIEGDVAPM